jgi:predicted GNAT family acetyltransferase
MSLAISDAPAHRRYEARLDGQLAGILEYVVKGDRIALVHTEVAESYEGRGIGAGLARFALDEARRRGLRVIASCPYVRRYLVKHPEDHDIVVGMTTG